MTESDGKPDANPSEAPPVAPAPARSSPWIIVALGLGFAALLGVTCRMSSPVVSGSLRVDGVSCAAQRCAGAGNGAEVLLEGNHGLVIMSNEGHAQATFDGDPMARCDVARVRMGNGRAGGSRNFAGYAVTSGSVTLDCRTSRGVHVEGQLEFDRCRQ